MDTDTEVASGTDAAVSTPPDGWREMKRPDLAALCKAAGLSDVGKRAALVKRLDAHWHGSTSQHINGKTLCPYCRAVAQCNGTRHMSDTVVRRSYRCRGKRRHSFSLVETVAGSR